MRMSSKTAVRSSLVLALVIALVVGLWVQMPQRAAAQTNSALTISSPRPVAKAIEELIDKYGYVITYEDPPYEYKGDLNDVAQLYRRDFKRYPSGKAPKLWVPLGGSVQLQLPIDTKPNGRDIQNALQQLVQSQFDANQGGGHFAVEEEGAAFHVIPTEVRDASGGWKSVESILATPISLPTEARTQREMLKAICAAVDGKIGVRIDPVVNSGVVIGLVEFGAQSHKYTIGAQDEPASSVLMRTFQLMGLKRTWLLFYDPTTRSYALNIIDLPSSPSAAH